MTNATPAHAPNAAPTVAALKAHDGSLPAGGFPAYLQAHKGAPVARSVRASERRRAAACELGGYSVGEYNRKAEAFVAALMARAPAEVAAHPYVLVHAYAYASHRALRDARAKAEAEGRWPGRDAYPCYGQAAE